VRSFVLDDATPAPLFDVIAVPRQCACGLAFRCLTSLLSSLFRESRLLSKKIDVLSEFYDGFNTFSGVL
jgi:hypothetical protein